MNSNRISNTARERKTQYPEMELETGDTGKLPDHGQRLSSVPRRRPLPSTAAAGVEQRGGGARRDGAEPAAAPGELCSHAASCSCIPPGETGSSGTSPTSS